MRSICLFLGAASILLISASASSAQRPCGFGFWEEGEKCRKGPLICERSRYHEFGSGTKQWKCWHRKGVKWRPSKKAKMRRFHWF